MLPTIPFITTIVPTCVTNGTSTITNYDNIATYTFTPAGPNVGVGGIITGMVVGTAYTVTAGNGICISNNSVAFTNLAMLTTPVVPIITTAVPTCFADGNSTITNYNNTTTYTFDPNGPTISASGDIMGMILNTPYTVTSAGVNCTSTASGSFTNLAMLPTISAINLTSGCNGINYTITVESPNSNYTYNWFNSSGNSISNGSQIIITSSDTYEVQVSNGLCTESEFITIDNVYCSIPKGLSPNGDGLNDTWELSNLDIRQVKIFNRYGTELYSKENYTNEWNGKSKGKELPSATYYYVIWFNNNTTKTGWVYLNR